MNEKAIYDYLLSFFVIVNVALGGAIAAKTNGLGSFCFVSTPRVGAPFLRGGRGRPGQRARRSV